MKSNHPHQNYRMSSMKAMIW